MGDKDNIRLLLEEMLSRLGDKHISNGDAEIIARAITSRLKPFFDNVILRTVQKVSGSGDVSKEIQELHDLINDKFAELQVEVVKKKDTIYLLANLIALLANVILLVFNLMPK